MTAASTGHAEQTRHIDMTQRHARRRPPYALMAIFALGAVLYGWVLWTGSWGNTYYTAAVKSMSSSFTNFLFGSFDPAGVVTMDKPPLALWPQVISTWIFGYHSWSVLLPQVIEGVAAIFLLHRTVRMWAGENAALIAALVFTLTPITVATTRTNNTDTMLVLTLIAAAYTFTRATKTLDPRTRTKWLLFTASLLGFGFLAKMFAAWMVAPAFFAAYLAGTTAQWRRKVLDLTGASVVLLASSLWWVAVVDLWPGEKPYIGGSTDGTALDLVLGYNGLGRLLGSESNNSGGGPGGPGGASFGGSTGAGRMFGVAVGGQISWLLPLALIALVVAAVAGVRRLRRAAPAEAASRAGWVLWGAWLVVNVLVFSFQKGIFHPYYTTVMAPAIAALVGAGAVWAFRKNQEPEGLGRFVPPAAVVVTAVWAWVLISRDTSWHGWLRYAVAVVALAAILALVLRKAARAGLVLGLGAVLLAPAVWSAASAMDKTGMAALPAAGPPDEMMGYFGAPAGQLTADQRKILDYATSHSSGAEITLAIEGGASAAEPYIVATDKTIVAMGGFSGRDLAPSADQLSTWVREGKLRFVLTTDGMMAADNTDPERSQWLKKHCKPVFTVGADGGEDPQDDKDGQSSQDTQDGGAGMGGMGGQTLHECTNA